MPKAIPGRRYYGGCEHVDVVENLARDRAKQLFGADHANVQPHSGSQANLAVYLTAVQPGDTVLGLDLAHGGHLTHGMKLNISGMLYNFISYGVTRDTHRIDFDRLGGGAAGGARAQAEADRGRRGAPIRARYRTASLLRSHTRSARSCSSIWPITRGLVAAGLHDNPVPVADFVTTTTHKTLRGPRAGLSMCKAEYAKDLDRSVFPGIQGGPLMHVVAGKAICFGEGAAQLVQTICPGDHRQRQTLADCLVSGGARLVSGGTDNHLMLVDVHHARPWRQAGRSHSGRVRHHSEQEHESLTTSASRWIRRAFASGRRR